MTSSWVDRTNDGGTFLGTECFKEASKFFWKSKSITVKEYQPGFKSLDGIWIKNLPQDDGQTMHLIIQPEEVRNLDNFVAPKSSRPVFSKKRDLWPFIRSKIFSMNHLS